MTHDENRIAATECLALYNQLSVQDRYCVPEEYVAQLRQDAIPDYAVAVGDEPPYGWQAFSPLGQEMASKMLEDIRQAREDSAIADVITAAEILGVYETLDEAAQSWFADAFIREMKELAGDLKVKYTTLVPLDMQDISPLTWNVLARITEKHQ